MSRPRGMPETYEPEEGEGPVLPDPLAGYEYRPGKRGPRSTLRPAMIPIIAEDLARYGVLRKAAAKAGTTEDCLSRWLRQGQSQVARKRRSLYTELLQAVEEAKAHRMGWLIERGEQSLVDRHSNPRFATWLLSVLAPKQFTVPRDPSAPAGLSPGLEGTPFEMVSPDEAVACLETKLRKFLALEDRRLKAEADAAAAASAGASDGGE